MKDIGFPAPGHDHDACIARIVDRARDAFAAQGSRLTELREAVLRTLASSHEALGAYDIQQRLADHGRQVAPISIYRVLDCLLEAGLIHRLESRNAFLACHGEHEAARPVLFLVCDECGMVAESSPADISRALGQSASEAGFTLADSVLEARGLCAHCAGRAAARPRSGGHA